MVASSLKETGKLLVAVMETGGCRRSTLLAASTTNHSLRTLLTTTQLLVTVTQSPYLSMRALSTLNGKAYQRCLRYYSDADRMRHRPPKYGELDFEKILDVGGG